MINLRNENLVQVFSALGVGKPSISVISHRGLSYTLYTKYLSRYDYVIGTVMVHRPSNPYTGIQFADTTVWLAVATVLAVFRISKVVEGGVEVTPEAKFTDNAIR